MKKGSLAKRIRKEGGQALASLGIIFAGVGVISFTAIKVMSSDPTISLFFNGDWIRTEESKYASVALMNNLTIKLDDGSSIANSGMLGGELQQARDVYVHNNVKDLPCTSVYQLYLSSCLADPTDPASYVPTLVDFGGSSLCSTTSPDTQCETAAQTYVANKGTGECSESSYIACHYNPVTLKPVNVMGADV